MKKLIALFLALMMTAACAAAEVLDLSMFDEEALLPGLRALILLAQAG